MSKNKPVMINYGPQRILIDTIAGYLPIYDTPRSGVTKYGIRFTLRTGADIQQMGDDKTARDKLLTFLDNHFKVVVFTALRCTVCSARKPGNGSHGCDQDCNEYHEYPKFKRIEDAQLPDKI